MGPFCTGTAAGPQGRRDEIAGLGMPLGAFDYIPTWRPGLIRREVGVVLSSRGRDAADFEDGSPEARALRGHGLRVVLGLSGQLGLRLLLVLAHRSHSRFETHTAPASSGRVGPIWRRHGPPGARESVFARVGMNQSLRRFA